MNKLLLFLSLLIFHYSFSIAEVRYVSHSGTNTPPYLTWKTAADSIMSAINISSFGDTIYVAKGVYEEQVVMIPGLTLIGAGMDSCIIDTRSLVNSNGFIAVDVADSCIFMGFQILVYINTSKGYGIAVRGNDLITENKINNAWHGVYVGWTGNKLPKIYNNILDTVSMGVEIFNASPIVRKNIIYTDPNSQSAVISGIHIEAFDFSYHPTIDSNYIETDRRGIDKSYGARPIISNNEILLKGVGGEGILLGGPSDTTKVFNNKIYALSGMEGIYPSGVQYLFLINNYCAGNFDDQQNLKYVITLGPDQTAINNVVTNAERGVKAVGVQNLEFHYNNVWNNITNYSGFYPDNTNLSVNPMVINADTIKNGPDFHLQLYSPLIDRGDPYILDKDSTRSDIGLYGGPFGESYKYLDLPPRIPVNLSAAIDSDYILLKWNKNTEADFSHYNLYRDTTENFTADSSTFVISLTDTFYSQIIPPGLTDLYFKLTAVDRQGNQSEPSEELHIILTGTINNEEFTINNYKLFQNYPNPFNPATKIGYRLKERGYVKLYVYDIKGELVETLVNKYQEGGYYEVNFSAGQDSGPDIASGVYIYQIMVRNEKNIPVFTEIKKMVYLK